jgi:hypothetical protein
VEFSVQSSDRRRRRRQRGSGVDENALIICEMMIFFIAVRC